MNHIPDSMHTCSKFDFLSILSRYDKVVMSNLWQNSCKANGIISDHSLAKQVCSKTVAILSESACVTMVTSALALTCWKLVMNLQTCHAELAASLQTYNARFAASLLQVKIAIWVRTNWRRKFKYSIIELEESLCKALWAKIPIIFQWLFYIYVSFQTWINEQFAHKSRRYKTLLRVVKVCKRLRKDQYHGNDFKRIRQKMFKKFLYKPLKKITCKITIQNNVYSLCCIFTVFYCKFHARVLYVLHFPVIFPAHTLEICGKTL